MSTEPNTTPTPSPLPADSALIELLHQEREQRRAADESIRQNPIRRLKMIVLIEHLYQLIEQAAYEVALARNATPDPWDEEREADYLVWLLTEFLVQAELMHDPNEQPPTVAAHHLGQRFARSWFNVDLDMNHNLIIKD